jgi:hypothetical protein
MDGMDSSNRLWLTCIANARVRYPYPLFALLSTWQRVALFTVSATLMTASTMMLKWVYGKVNGIESFKRDALNPLKVD